MRAACVMTLGLAIAAVGFAVLTQVGTENGLVPVMIALGLLNFGVAPTIALGTDMMIASAPPEKAGAVSAISETCHELGLGMASRSSAASGPPCTAARSRTPCPPACRLTRPRASGTPSVPDETGRLPGGLGTAALDAARAAFTDSLFYVSVICTVITLLVVFTVPVLLRRVPTGDDGATAGGSGVHESLEATDPQSM